MRHIFILTVECDKEKRHHQESWEESSPRNRGCSSTLNRRSGKRVFYFHLRERLFRDLALSYRTYDESSKFSGALSHRNAAKLFHMRISVAGFGRPRCTKECSLEEGSSDFRKRGRKEITYVPILMESGLQKSGPRHPRSSVPFPILLCEPTIVPRHGSFVDRSSRFSLEYHTFVSADRTVSAREFTGTSPSSYLCDITNVFGIRRSIDSPPNGNASLTFTVSNYKADIE